MNKKYSIIFFFFFIIFYSSAAHSALINTPWVHTEALIGQQAAVKSDTDEGFKYSDNLESVSSVSEHSVCTLHSVNFNSRQATASMQGNAKPKLRVEAILFGLYYFSKEVAR